MIEPSFGRELLERYGSPLYVYDLDEAERQAKALFEMLPKSAQVLYSVKANPIPELSAALRTAGCRVEIASSLELKVVQEAGFAPDQILCSGPGKTASLVREMLHAGVSHFSCDSWYDLERLAPRRLEKPRSLRTPFCDFRFPAHRLEASVSVPCRATSAWIRRNYSMMGPGGLVHFEEPN